MEGESFRFGLKMVATGDIATAYALAFSDVKEFSLRDNIFDAVNEEKEQGVVIPAAQFRDLDSHQQGLYLSLFGDNLECRLARAMVSHTPLPNEAVALSTKGMCFQYPLPYLSGKVNMIVMYPAPRKDRENKISPVSIFASMRAVLLATAKYNICAIGNQPVRQLIIEDIGIANAKNGPILAATYVRDAYDKIMHGWHGVVQQFQKDRWSNI